MVQEKWLSGPIGVLDPFHDDWPFWTPTYAGVVAAEDHVGAVGHELVKFHEGEQLNDEVGCYDDRQWWL